jgi:hypothetical protein
MPLQRLIYVSLIADGVSESDVEALVRRAHRSNAQHEITGILWSSRGFFLHCLEGRRANVAETMQKIMADPRHTDIAIVHLSEPLVREFPDWPMRLILDSDFPPEDLLADAVNLLGDPFMATGEKINTFVSSILAWVRTAPLARASRQAKPKPTAKTPAESTPKRPRKPRKSVASTSSGFKIDNSP